MSSNERFLKTSQNSLSPSIEPRCQIRGLAELISMHAYFSLFSLIGLPIRIGKVGEIDKLQIVTSQLVFEKLRNDVIPRVSLRVRAESQDLVEENICPGKPSISFCRAFRSSLVWSRTWVLHTLRACLSPLIVLPLLVV